MHVDEFIKQQAAAPSKRKHSDEEHRIQCSCVRWFRYQYPTLSEILFAVPNGGSRNKIEALRMKKEGVTSGVSDLILLKSNRFYGSLCIEMKTSKGRQSKNQLDWQKEVESSGNKYCICRSLEEFKNAIQSYLKDS